MNAIFWLLVAAFLDLCIYSFLYKDNRFFKFGETTVVGIAVGVECYAGYRAIMSAGVIPVLSGKVIMIPALILGILIFGRLSRKTIPLSNYSLITLMGIGLGLATRGALIGQITSQIKATMLPFTTANMLTNFNNLIVIVGTITATLYFIFTREHTGTLGVITKIGRYFIMCAMGTTFGAMALTFGSPAIGAMFEMFEAPGIYLTVIVGIIILADILRKRTSSEKESNKAE